MCPGRWYLWNVMQAFPGWTLKYADRAIEKDQERGWPIREMLLFRAFEAKLREIQSAESPDSGIPPPQDKLAMRVYKARRDANERYLAEFAKERLSPAAVLAKAGVRAE